MIVSFDKDAFQFYEDCYHCTKTGYYGKYDLIEDVSKECCKCMKKYEIFDGPSMIEVCNNLERFEEREKWISEHKEEVDAIRKQLFGDLK